MLKTTFVVAFSIKRITLRRPTLNALHDIISWSYFHFVGCGGRAVSFCNSNRNRVQHHPLLAPPPTPSVLVSQFFLKSLFFSFHVTSHTHTYTRTTGGESIVFLMNFILKLLELPGMRAKLKKRKYNGMKTGKGSVGANTIWSSRVKQTLIFFSICYNFGHEWQSSKRLTEWLPYMQMT